MEETRGPRIHTVKIVEKENKSAEIYLDGEAFHGACFYSIERAPELPFQQKVTLSFWADATVEKELI
jgi:hypothetical protein